MGTDIIKIAICDDEKVIIDRLRGYIEKYIKKAGFPYKIDIYQSGEEFAKFLILNFIILPHF